MGILFKAPLAPTPSYDGLAWLLVIACIIYGLAGSKSSLAAAFNKECFGTAIIVLLTFSPGRWFGVNAEPVFGVPAAWVFQAAGIVMTDWTCGGPHVNPGISFAFWLLGKIQADEMFINMIAQTVGATVGIVGCQAFAAAAGWQPLAGPEISASIAGDALTTACSQEFAAMAVLCIVVYALNFEPSARIQGHHFYYIVKQTLTAVAIRAIIICLPAAGPAINPALATGWQIFKAGGELPTFAAFWQVYWLAAFAGALAATAAYAVYSPSATFMGRSLR